MNMIGRIGCVVGLHRRSGSRVSYDGIRPISVCRYCKTPMMKVEGVWRTGSVDAVPTIGALDR